MDYRDGIVCIGLALAAAGIALWSRPAALIFCGVCLVLIGFFARPRPRNIRSGD